MQPPGSHLHRIPPRQNTARTHYRPCEPPRKKNRPRCRRLKHYRLTDTKLVLNLSDKILNAHHLSILQKGLNFIPTPTFTNKIHTVKDLLLFNRRTRLTHFFQNSPDYSSDSPFPRPNKGWVPPSGLDPDIDSFTHHLLHDSLSAQPSHKPKSNLTPEELVALRDLSSDTSITIKPADKGGATVIWSTSLYEQEALRQLNNQNHYKPVLSNLTFEHHTRITARLRELSQIGHVPANSEKSLINPDCRISPFYLLPKIHIPGNQGRPIVSGIDSPTDRISHTVDLILRPYVAKLKSHIKDTQDFICKLQDIHSLHDDDLMVTIDVSSLYTSIPHQDGIKAVERTLNQARHLPIPLQTILEMVEMTLTMNTFKFKNSYYHQVQGTAMGTKMAPSYANIFMGVLENEILNSCDLPPTIWLRFIDDIFAIYRASEDEVISHIEALNQFHPTIKFTSNINRNHIDFLDVTVYRNQDNSIGTRLFIKPTNTGQYLNASSYHPKHQIESITYSQAIRMRLICSDIMDFDSSTKVLLKNLTLCGHNHHKCKTAISRAREVPRESLLHPPPKTRQKIIPFVVTYTPHNRYIPASLKAASRALKPNPNNQRFLEYRLLVAFRRSANLRDILFHSEHPPPRRKPTCRPCMKFTCNCAIISSQLITYHQLIRHNHVSTSLGTIPDSYSVVYSITCPVCGKLYIGQTGRNIRIRIAEHKCDINRRDREQPVAKHFIDHNAQSQDILVTILDNTARDKNTRLRLEEAWIRVLNTIQPNGINLHL